MSLLFRILILAFIFFSHLHAKQTHFKVSYDPDYAPFSYLENNKPVGLFIDYWKLWAEANNYTIEFVKGKNWVKALELAQKNKVDFFLGTAAYEKWMKASDSFYKTGTSLFILKNNSRSFSKSGTYIIGVIGKDYKKYIQKEFPNSEVIIYKDYSSLFQDFISQKIDLVFDDKIAIEFYALRNNLFHNIKSISLLKYYSNIQAISSQQALIKIFNDGLKALSLEELYDIESKWILNENQRYYEKANEIFLTNYEKEFVDTHKINVSISKKWKPFSYLGENKKPNGISFEIWELISKRLGLNYTYSFYNSFSEQLNSIKNKKEDIIFSTGETPDRKEYSIFTQDYMEFPISIVTLKDENFIESINYLFDKRIAVGKNFTAHKMLKEKYPKLNLLLVENVEQGLKSVLHKDAYAYIDIRPVLTYNINKLGFEDLKITGNTGLVFKVKMMIRKDYKTLQSILNKAIISLKENEVNNIVNKWTNIQFEDSFDYTKLWMAVIIVLLLFTILIYLNQLNIKRNKLLKIKVEERTRELVRLNELLELKVEEKTKQLKRTNYLLDEAQKIAHLGSFQYNIQKDELIWSDEHFKIFGLYPNEIKPSIDIFLSFVHKDNKRYIVNQLDKIRKSDKKVVSEFKIILKNGSIKYIQSTSKVTKFDHYGEALIVIGTILDLTKLKKLEIEKRENDSILAQQSKMAAMGEMLENIAHQWRQPLSVISTASTGMQLQLEMGDKIPEEVLIENIKSINEHAQYLSKTIEDFRNFFSPNRTKINFDIKDSIEKSLYLVNSRSKTTKTEIIKDLKSREIYALESELIQVLLNILNNSFDALESNTIRKKLIFVTIVVEKEKISICIKDNANGIDKKILNRIFEPYFTTKHKSQGTGIGLYMSSQIIIKHFHGSIKVRNVSYEYDNQRFKGAEFKISIPL